MKKLDAIDTQLISASCQISVFSFGCKEYMNLESASMHQRYAGKHRNGKLAKQDFCQYYAKSALKGESFVMVNKAVNFMTICLHFISGSIFCDSSHQAQSAARRLLHSASQLGFATALTLSYSSVANLIFCPKNPLKLKRGKSRKKVLLVLPSLYFSIASTTYHVLHQNGVQRARYDTLHSARH